MYVILMGLVNSKVSRERERKKNEKGKEKRNSTGSQEWGEKKSGINKTGRGSNWDHLQTKRGGRTLWAEIVFD